MKKLSFNFQNIDTVQGHCHHCDEESILLVSTGALISGMAYVIFALVMK